MRKQIAAANWKMNCTYVQAQNLLDDILKAEVTVKPYQQVIFAVPYPYLIMAKSEVAIETNYFVAAQDCSSRISGAYTGEVSAEILASIDIPYCIVGHSERREHAGDNNRVLLEKINRCLENNIKPIFCCGESLEIRDSGTQNSFVETQLNESLFHLAENDVQKVIIAYEPIWAIGTGKTASSQQAQEMHAHLRAVIAGRYGANISENISILYGGSVKAGNATELFACPDVDGGLVGGASLIAADFVSIIKSLKEF